LTRQKEKEMIELNKRITEDGYQPSKTETEAIRQTLNRSDGIPTMVGPYQITSRIG